jgi:hypothetical protein
MADKKHLGLKALSVLSKIFAVVSLGVAGYGLATGDSEMTVYGVGGASAGYGSSKVFDKIRENEIALDKLEA